MIRDEVGTFFKKVYYTVEAPRMRMKRRTPAITAMKLKRNL